MGRDETSNEPLYKKWTTWLATLMPVILFFVGWYFGPPDETTSQKLEKYDTLWVEYLQTKRRCEGLDDSLSAVYISIYKKHAYIEILEGRLEECSGELSATTRLYMQREADRYVDTMPYHEKESMRDEAFRELSVIQ